MSGRILSAREIAEIETQVRDGEFFADDAMDNLFATLRAYQAVVEAAPKALRWLKWWVDPQGFPKPAPLAGDDLDDTIKAFETALADIPQETPAGDAVRGEP